ncbi:MAG: metallophosphoesterase [Magnetococcales bacterium]|nr:metallophosphoesterase [Magnetococcales bacterium]
MSWWTGRVCQHVPERNFVWAYSLQVQPEGLPVTARGTKNRNEAILLYDVKDIERFKRSLRACYDSNTEIIRLLQISDLHAAPIENVPESKDEQLYLNNFQDILVKWKEHFVGEKEMPKFDGLIISGDFIDAQKLGLPNPQKNYNQDDHDSYKEKLSRAHTFACGCVNKFLEHIHINNSSTNRSIPCLVVPGNHDVFLYG